MKITEILKKKEQIYPLMHAWGFNIEESAPSPQLYLDPYEERGEAKLCLLAKSHPQLEDVSNRRHFLEYELEKLLQCAVSVVQMNNLIGEEQKQSDLVKAIDLSAEEKDIITHYGAEKDPLLESTAAEMARGKLKQQIKHKVSALSLKNFSGTLLAPQTPVSHKSGGEDKEVLRFLEYIRSNKS